MASIEVVTSVEMLTFPVVMGRCPFCAAYQVIYLYTESHEVSLENACGECNAFFYYEMSVMARK